jgi:CubicO group peptidase (beta-lactamase class C family)
MQKTAFSGRYGFARPDVTLGNWRTRPYSAWSFQNVAELVPSAEISTSATIEDETLESLGPLLGESIDTGNGTETVLGFLRRSNTDTLAVMKAGAFVGQYSAPTADPSAPHLIFSISKSLTAILAGVLQDERLLDPADPVTRYVPEAKGSAYDGATVQQVLDMRVSLDFVEAYLDPESDFARYRRAMLWNPMRASDKVETLREVILSLPKADGPHGGPFHYYSPLSDLLGIIVERASGLRYADLLREKLWIPLRARGRCTVTVDAEGTARAAGGVSMTARDLARVGEMMRNGGMAGSRAIVSERWVRDTISTGDQAAWKSGDFAHLLKDGSYRNKWYQSGFDNGAFMAIGIHGQWLYVDPLSEVVIVRMSSQHEPDDDPLSQQTMRFFRAVAEMV